MGCISQRDVAEKCTDEGQLHHNDAVVFLFFNIAVSKLIDRVFAKNIHASSCVAI
jgi:hypothetical protein